jgi:Family of unknown function (DUF6491)
MNKQHAKTLIALLALGIAASAGAADKPIDLSAQATIPFVNHGGIRDWRADNLDGLWIQDIHRQWFYAQTMGACIGLDFAWTIGFDTRPMGTLDRFSSILVPHESRCPIRSLTRSDAPPPKVKKGKTKAEAAISI